MVESSPLPACVAHYLHRDGNDDDDLVSHVFAADACVQDEGQSYLGHAAISRWRRQAKQRYRYTTQAMSWHYTSEDVLVVQVRVAGDFPGSPAVLAYRFTLRQAQIQALKIG